MFVRVDGIYRRFLPRSTKPAPPAAVTTTETSDAASPVLASVPLLELLLEVLPELVVLVEDVPCDDLLTRKFTCSTLECLTSSSLPSNTV